MLPAIDTTDATLANPAKCILASSYTRPHSRMRRWLRRSRIKTVTHVSALTIAGVGKHVACWPFFACHSPIERRVRKPGSPSAPPMS